MFHKIYLVTFLVFIIACSNPSPSSDSSTLNPGIAPVATPASITQTEQTTPGTIPTNPPTVNQEQTNLATPNPSSTSNPATKERTEVPSGEGAHDHDSDEQTSTSEHEQYNVECVDIELGIKRSDEIFYGNEKMTKEETNKVNHCALNTGQKNEIARKTEGAKSPKATIVNVWRPEPKDTACADRVMGIKAYREIYQGERPPSKNESLAWKECLPNLPIDSIVHPVSDITCPDMDTMWKFRQSYAPSWDQIRCHTDSLVRYNLPKFRAHDRFNVSGSVQNADSIWSFSLKDLLSDLIAKNWKEYDKSTYEGRDQDLWKVMQLTEEHLRGNWAFMPMGDFPPYIDEFWNNIAYPENDYWHDQALRIFALHAIQRKNKGHSIVMVDFYPPGSLGAPAADSKEFRQWVDTVFIPQKIREAKAAELLKAEILFPLPIEIERWIQGQPWAKDTPVEEKIQTAQYVLDQVYDRVRPFFKGKLNVWSYANYLPDRDGPAWEKLVFSKYDEVSFHLFPECDLSFSVSYTENQMKHVMNIVKRDGLTWWIGEWDLGEKPFEQLCGTNMSVEAEPIMNAMLNVIFAQPIQPMGIDYRGPIYSGEQLDLIKNRIFILADH